jgi:hypothetical protein
MGMTDQLTAEILLERINRARDFARQEQQAYQALVDRGVGPDEQAGELGAFGSTIWLCIYDGVGRVLDEILQSE